MRGIMIAVQGLSSAPLAVLLLKAGPRGSFSLTPVGEKLGLVRVPDNGNYRLWARRFGKPQVAICGKSIVGNSSEAGP